MVKNVQILKFKCDILSNFQTVCKSFIWIFAPKIKWYKAWKFKFLFSDFLIHCLSACILKFSWEKKIIFYPFLSKFWCFLKAFKVIFPLLQKASWDWEAERELRDDRVVHFLIIGNWRNRGKQTRKKSFKKFFSHFSKIFFFLKIVGLPILNIL